MQVQEFFRRELHINQEFEENHLKVDLRRPEQKHCQENMTFLLQEFYIQRFGFRYKRILLIFPIWNRIFVYKTVQIRFCRKVFLFFVLYFE